MRIHSIFTSIIGAIVCLGCDPAAQREMDRSGSTIDDSPFGATAGHFGPPIFPPFDGGDVPFRGPILRSEVAPPPIQGGTLLVASDGVTVAVADPDRDRVVLVDVARSEVRVTVPLEAGDEPGRLAEDSEGRVHVVLRRAGRIATIDLATGSLLRRSEVCRAPQGIAHDPAAGVLHVACAEGALVSLSPATGEVVRHLQIDSDLRDVVVQGDRLLVSRFKSSELITLDGAGAVVERRRPEDVIASADQLAGETPPIMSAFTVLGQKRFAPNVAWRLATDGTETLTMLHQRGQVDPIDLGDKHTDTRPDTQTDPEVDAGAGHMFDDPPRPFDQASDNPYGGGGDDCNGIVQTGVTAFDPDGKIHSLPAFAGATLAVDVARSPDARWLAIAVAGKFDASLDPFGFRAPGSSAIVFDTEQSLGDRLCVGPFDPPISHGTPGQGVAVAFGRDGQLVVQMREPSRLVVFPAGGRCPTCEDPIEIALGGAPRRDTGHDLFHHDAGAGLACASCHPGGKDDGHTWEFVGLGPRRTQQFTMGLRGTEPLHWDAEFANFDELVAEVFVRRMGGPELDREQTDVMADWIETLRPLPAPRRADEPAVLAGKALFESDDVGCASCHSGPKFTNNVTVDVGTGGGPLQVPSLVGVAYRQPFMHNGCAATLLERFDPACGGGDQHGMTSHLTASELDDLVAYLESL